MANNDTSLVEQVFDLPQRQGKRTYIMTAKRITSGDVLKYRNGFCIRRGYAIDPDENFVQMPAPLDMRAHGIVRGKSLEPARRVS